MISYFFFEEDKKILNYYFCDNCSINWLFYIPGMCYTFVAYQRNPTCVLLGILAFVTNVYRSNIGIVNYVVFRFGRIFFFFFLFLLLSTFVERVRRISSYRTIFLQIAGGHLVPKHFALISLECTHVFFTVFTQRSLQNTRRNRSEEKEKERTLRKFYFHLFKSVFLLFTELCRKREPDKRSRDLGVAQDAPRVLYVLLPTGYFHDPAERNDPPTVGGRVAVENGRMVSVATPTGCLMVSLACDTYALLLR